MQIGIVALRHKSQVLGERTTREARFRLGGGGVRKDRLEGDTSNLRSGGEGEGEGQFKEPDSGQYVKKA